MHTSSRLLHVTRLLAGDEGNEDDDAGECNEVEEGSFFKCQKFEPQSHRGAANIAELNRSFVDGEGRLSLCRNPPKEARALVAQIY